MKSVTTLKLTLAAGLLLVCASASWAVDAPAWEALKQKSDAAASRAAQKDAAATQAATELSQATDAASEAAKRAAAAEAEVSLALRAAKDTEVPGLKKLESGATQKKLDELQYEYDEANGLLIIANGKLDRGEPVTLGELTGAANRQKRAEARLLAQKKIVEDAEARAQLHPAALARVQTAKAAAAEAEAALKAAQAAENTAAATKAALAADAAKADEEARLALADLAAVPAPKIVTRQDKLDQLLEIYKANEIDPATYQERRAKIMAEPDAGQ